MRAASQQSGFAVAERVALVSLPFLVTIIYASSVLLLRLLPSPRERSLQAEKALEGAASLPHGS